MHTPGLAKISYHWYISWYLLIFLISDIFETNDIFDKNLKLGWTCMVFTLWFMYFIGCMGPVSNV